MFVSSSKRSITARCVHVVGVRYFGFHRVLDRYFGSVEGAAVDPPTSHPVFGRYFGSVEGCYHVENLSAKNMKRTFVDYGGRRDWFDAEQGEGHEFLHEACQVKNIWVPMGA